MPSTSCVEFDPDDDLIIVTAQVYGKHGHRRVTLALDTAASHTHVTPDVIDELGYSPTQGQAITSVRSAIGKGLDPQGLSSTAAAPSGTSVPLVMARYMTCRSRLPVGAMKWKSSI